MKILTAKEKLINTKFAYYAMQVVECDNYNHKRYWISEFSKKLIPLPPKKEQVEIVNAIEELYKYIEQILSWGSVLPLIANWITYQFFQEFSPVHFVVEVELE